MKYVYLHEIEGENNKGRDLERDVGQSEKQAAPTHFFAFESVQLVAHVYGGEQENGSRHHDVVLQHHK